MGLFGAGTGATYLLGRESTRAASWLNGGYHGGGNVAGGLHCQGMFNKRQQPRRVFPPEVPGQTLRPPDQQLDHVFVDSVLSAYRCPASVSCRKRSQCRRPDNLLLRLLPPCCFCKGGRDRTESAILANELWTYRVRITFISWRRYGHQWAIRIGRIDRGS